jgi:hypothetical protein
MARVRTIQNAFSAGEWAPRTAARSDLAKFKNAAQTLQNVTCFKQGGVTRRPGTRYVATVKTPSKKTRLVPFISASNQAFVLEFGENYIRFYKNGAPVLSGGVPYQVATTYLATEIFQLHFAQSVDVLYIAHPNHAPSELLHFSDTSWNLILLNFGAGAFGFTNGPYRNEDELVPGSGNLGFTLTPSATTGGTITITASAPFFRQGYTSPGTLIKLQQGTAFGWGYITAETDTTHAQFSVVGNFGSTATADHFWLGAWYVGNFGVASNNPACVTLFQQRTWWANTPISPDTLWASQTSDYLNMDEGTGQADEALTFTLASNQLNAIQWIAPALALLVGTIGQEWEVSGGDPTIAITPSTVVAKQQTTHGSANLSPIQAYNATIFVQRAGRKLRELSYNLYSSSYIAPDLALLSEHMTLGGVAQMDYQQELDSIIWMIRNDGTLVGVTYERVNGIVGVFYDKTDDVVAWHRQITGPNQDLSDGKFESVAVIPAPDGTQDQTWVVVNRTVNGVQTRFVEYLDTEGGFYGYLNVDAGMSYSGVSTSTITGLAYLNGATVDVLGNGLVQRQKVVSGGQITLDSPVTSAEVGLHFPSTIETLRPEAGGDAGTAQGAHKRYNQIFARLYNTMSVTINGNLISFPSLFSGDQRISNTGWDRDAYITIQQTQPLPLTLLSIFGTLDVGDA